MATFTEAQITDLAEILATDSDTLDAHLDFYAAEITDADKTRILERVTEWQAIENHFVSAEPNAANGGGRYSPESHRAALAVRIARLIRFEQGASASSFQIALERG